MAVYSDGTEYGIEKDLIISVPVECKNFEWQIVKNVKLNEFS